MTEHMRAAILGADRDGYVPALTPGIVVRALARRGLVARHARHRARLTDDGYHERRRLRRAGFR